MKKKILTMVIVLCVAMSMLAGCSSKSRQSSADASEFTVEEIKDFMLVVTDADDTSYAFTFESKPDGLENVAVGDTVTVTYTGTVTEVDGFDGEILSVEKQ